MSGDNVYHPQHYSRWKMEPIEFIAINDLPWWLANVIKYTMRFDAKDGLQDLYKARSYLDMKIRQIEEHPRFWEKPVAEERRLSKKEEEPLQYRMAVRGSCGVTHPDKDTWAACEMCKLLDESRVPGVRK